MVLHDEVLPDPRVRRTLAGRFALTEVDVDQSPVWMDLPDVQGLPSIVFFDRDGRHVLTKSGYRPVTDLVVLLRAVDEKLQSKDMSPYERPPVSRLADAPITAQTAQQVLDRWESKTFIRVNSNDGGFDSPSRHPRPKLLLELARWESAPARVSDWIDLTVESANRGTSPNLDGKPLPDMDFSNAELRRFSREGAGAGPGWREGIETLPTQDPYLGLRDPIDGGFFRYAAGPGWYHPHFERLAAQNLAWALLFRERGNEEDASKTLAWVIATFARDDGWLDTAQASDPFYYRLPEKERSGVPAPPVAPNAALDVQAWAARVDSSRCAALIEAVDNATWPPAQLDARDAAPAPVNAVGEALIALSQCGDAGHRSGKDLATFAVSRWKKGLRKHPRLHRLAAGICAVEHPACGEALASVVGLPYSEEFPPPFHATAARTR